MSTRSTELLIISNNAPSPEYGGGQIYVANLLDELIRRGKKPSIAAPTTHIEEGIEYNGCRIYLLYLSMNLKY